MVAGAEGGDSAAGGFVGNGLKVETIILGPSRKGDDFAGSELRDAAIKGFDEEFCKEFGKLVGFAGFGVFVECGIVFGEFGFVGDDDRRKVEEV